MRTKIALAVVASGCSYMQRLDGYLLATTSPRIDSVSAGGPFASGSSGTLGLTGSHLVGGILPTLGDGVTVDTLHVTDEHHATVGFTVAPGAAPGPRVLPFLDAGTGPGDVAATTVYPDAFVVSREFRHGT